MTRELLKLAFVLAIFLSNCGQTNTENRNQAKHINVNQLDTSIIAVLPVDTTLHWLFKDNKQTDLTYNDLQKIETILIKCISEYNTDMEKQFKEIKDKDPEYKDNQRNFIIDLQRYKRQYVATINSKGEKEVWVNCFCNLHTDWRKYLIIVDDGGNCYFNLKINLTTKIYFELRVNGEA